MDKESITLIRPDDFHAHLRKGMMLWKTLPYSNVYGRIVAMGNLIPPIVTCLDARAYLMEIKGQGARFEPIMSVMFTRRTTPQMIYAAFQEGVRVLKLIPGGTSTGSDEGVPLAELKMYYDVLKAAQDCGMIFSGHWELLADPLTGANIGDRDREVRAIPYLAEVIEAFPGLKIVVEHVSTAVMADFVMKAPANVFATITAHHLGPFTYDDVCNHLGQPVRPALYCKPVLKTREDIERICAAAISGNPKFFFGSDSAPHPVAKKSELPPAAGIFSPAEAAIPWVWTIFEALGKSVRDFEHFVSRFGAEAYGLPVNQDTITLVKEQWTVGSSYHDVTPFLAGIVLDWKIAD
jgi:dihydroorotase